MVASSHGKKWRRMNQESHSGSPLRILVDSTINQFDYTDAEIIGSFFSERTILRKVRSALRTADPFLLVQPKESSKTRLGARCNFDSSPGLPRSLHLVRRPIGHWPIFTDNVENAAVSIRKSALSGFKHWCAYYGHRERKSASDSLRWG